MQQHRFANGLRVAVVERRQLPLVDIELVFPAGAALDDSFQAGRAVMLAEMLDEGTASRTVMQIADEVDFLGAHLNVNAGWDATGVTMHVLSERLLPLLDIAADIVINPSFPEAEFERKKRERLTALLQDRDEARVVANKALAAGVFGVEHPYGVPAVGTYASVSALTLADVRSFYEQYITPADAFLIVVGDVAFETVVRAIEERFGAWQRAPAPRRPVPPVLESGATRILLVDKPRAAQAEFRVGHTAPPRGTDDYFPLTVMNTVLGGAFTSRLNLRLREEMGVTYGASSRFGWRREQGIFWAGAAVDTDAAAASVAVTLNEMRRIRTEAIDEDELRRAAQYLAFGLPRSFETTEDIAAHLREQMLHDLGDDYWSRYVDRVLAVSPADALAVAARHLQPERAVAIVVADRRAVAEELEELGAGTVVITDVAT